MLSSRYCSRWSSPTTIRASSLAAAISALSRDTARWQAAARSSILCGVISPSSEAPRRRRNSSYVTRLPSKSRWCAYCSSRRAWPAKSSTGLLSAGLCEEPKAAARVAIDRPGAGGAAALLQLAADRFRPGREVSRLRLDRLGELRRRAGVDDLPGGGHALVQHRIGELRLDVGRDALPRRVGEPARARAHQADQP